jgi:hypothetical protein
MIQLCLSDGDHLNSSLPPEIYQIIPHGMTTVNYELLVYADLTTVPKMYEKLFCQPLALSW